MVVYWNYTVQHIDRCINRYTLAKCQWSLDEVTIEEGEPPTISADIFISRYIDQVSIVTLVASRLGIGRASIK